MFFETGTHHFFGGGGGVYTASSIQEKTNATNVDAGKNQGYSVNVLLSLLLPLLPPSVTGGARGLWPAQRDAGLLRDQQQNCLRLLSGGGGPECLRLRQAAVGHPAAHPTGQGGPDSRGDVGAGAEHPPATENG